MKMNILGSFSVVIAIWFNVFTRDNTSLDLENEFAGFYFNYDGPNFTLIELRNPNNYTFLTQAPIPCPGSEVVCWVFVDATNIYPASDPLNPNKPKVNLSTTTIYTRITQPEGTYTLPTEIIEREYH